MNFFIAPLFANFSFCIHIINHRILERADKVADVLLNIGTLLLSSGAHSGRVARNLKRISEVWGYQLETSSSFTGLLISIRDNNEPDKHITRFKRGPMNHIRFDIISDISHLSWKVHEEKLSVEDVDARVQEIQSSKGYSRIKMLIGIGIACASLCIATGGEWVSAAITFVAAFIGLYAKQELAHHRFNPFISTMGGAFVSSFIASLGLVYAIGETPEISLATSVLYLVPGVPLINCTIDVLEGYIPTAIGRAVFSSMNLLGIALGVTFSIVIFGIDKF